MALIQNGIELDTFVFKYGRRIDIMVFDYPGRIYRSNPVGRKRTISAVVMIPAGSWSCASTAKNAGSVRF